jgi:hypothetical protein
LKRHVPVLIRYTSCLGLPRDSGFLPPFASSLNLDIVHFELQTFNFQTPTHSSQLTTQVQLQSPNSKSKLKNRKLKHTMANGSRALQRKLLKLEANTRTGTTDTCLRECSGIGMVGMSMWQVQNPPASCQLEDSSPGIARFNFRRTSC